MEIFIVAFCFIVGDFVTGIVKAISQKKFSSSVMREGLFHKFASICCVCLAYGVDYAQSYIDLGFKVPVTISICSYIVLMEIGSIIENICIINPHIMPEKLQQYFLKLGGEDEPENNSKSESENRK